ncbi:MAG: murein L,D-transpeptidase catalytic domain family protein [Flavisolibacter sp.]
MLRKHLPFTLCLTAVLLILSGFKAGRLATALKVLPQNFNVNLESLTLESKTNLLYDSLKLGKMGLGKEAMKYAYKGHQALVKKGLLENEDILTVCDFSQPSSKKRMYIIDVRNFKVLINTYVAHGKNSGLKYAQKFSNKMQSHQSSLGFYITKGTYHGSHGLSLRLAGKEKGFNDNAEQRAIVVHGAGYIGDTWSGSATQGRSFGCPAIPNAISKKVIHYIKDGTALFVYHPSKSYLHGSKLLNG